MKRPGWRFWRAPMWRMTAVRLSIIYTLLFGLFATSIVFYVGYHTAGILQRQIQASVDEEVSNLSRVYRRTNLRRLVQVVERRSRAPGANLYLIADASGRIIAGNVSDVEPAVLSKNGWRRRPFEYSRFGGDDAEEHHAIAHIFTLPSGLRMLIGRDIGEAARFREIVRRATTLALAAMVLFGLIAWFFVGRRALKRIDSVSQSSGRILAGDLSQRLPVSGSGDEFDRLSENLNTLLARIERLNTGLRQVSDNIAHDLRTPLTRLRNKAEMALSAKRGHRKTLEGVIEEADRLIGTFNALLMISRVESGGQAADLTDIDLAPVLRDVFELFEPSAEESGAVLKLGKIPDLRAHGNRELVSQAISNLLDNAIKYGTEGADSPMTIALSSRKEGKFAVVEVADTGPGIPEEERERVKERFVRLDESRGDKGSGLGLALVSAIAELHGGELVLGDNEPGLLASLSLPLSS